MDYYKDIPVIETDKPATDVSHPTGVGFGYVPRDYAEFPEGMLSPPSEMTIVPQSDWDARYDEQEATKSSLEHIYLGGPGGTPKFVNLDQGADGDCWAYSTGHAMMLDRLKQNLPLVRLNPHATAAILKRYHGGWSGLSAQFATEHGYAVEGTGPGQWPKQSHDHRYDTPECRASMAQHKVVENWVDLTREVYHRNLTELQLATALFNNNPCPVDFSHWGHAVCALRMVRIAPGDWGLLILNSWKQWGRHGLGVLRGSKRIPNGAVSIRSTSPSVS